MTVNKRQWATPLSEAAIERKPVFPASLPTDREWTADDLAQYHAVRAAVELIVTNTELPLRVQWAALAGISKSVGR